MSKYIVLERFADMQDGNRIYDAGAEYPRVGISVSNDRLVALSTTSNGAGKPLIKEIVTNEAEAAKSNAKRVTNACEETTCKEKVKVDREEKIETKPSKKPTTKPATKSTASRKATKKK